MFDYTKAAFDKILNDFKKIILAFNIVTQLIYIAYLVYTLLARNGIFWANLVLLVLSLAHFGFFLYATVNETKKEITALVKTIYRRCKQGIKLFTLIVTLYGVWQTAENVDPLSIILCAFMLVGWVLGILFELVYKFIEKRVHLVIEGLKADYENMTKPARTVGNFFKKLTGKEVEEKEPTKERLFLEERVTEIKEEKKSLKLEEKRLKKEQKAEARMRKKAEREEKKQSKKSAQRTPAPVDTENSAELAVTKTEKKK